MEPDRLAELADHVADGPAEGVRERVSLAIQIAWKAGRHSMREEAARATVTKRRFQHARRIMKIIV